MQCVVLIYRDKLSLGGTDTLLVRLANSFSANGSTTITNSDPGPLASKLEKKVIIPAETNYRALFKHLSRLDFRTFDILLFDPHLLLRILPYISFYLRGRSVRLAVGIFHPRELFPENQPNWMHKAMKILFFSSQKGSWIFMNRACLASHERQFDRRLERFNIFPIYVDIPEIPNRRNLDRRTVSIVSVGRIVDFKAYNWGAIEIARKLRQEGISFRWTIFGEGAEREKLQEAARAAALSDCLRFEGLLDYSNFHSTMVDYDLFIGMGTSVLEAASTGIPSIVAVDSMPEGCYGFLHECPGDSIGEVIDGAKTLDIASKILEFCQLDHQERKLKGARDRERVKSLTLPETNNTSLFALVPYFRKRENMVGIALSCSFILFTQLRRIWRFLRRREDLGHYY